MTFLKLSCGWVNMGQVVHVEEGSNGCYYLYYHPRSERGQYLHLSSASDIQQVVAYLERNTWTQPQRIANRFDVVI
jgi:hypothetical protein